MRGGGAVISLKGRGCAVMMLEGGFWRGAD